MCNKNHSELKNDKVLWNSLQLIGQQITEADEYGPREVLELRNCTCGSTLAVVIK